MHADAAISKTIRSRIFPNSLLKGSANLLVMPNLDAANSAFNLAKVLGEGLHVGPILLGISQPAHIITPSVTSRGIVNITALAVVDAQADKPSEDPSTSAPATLGEIPPEARAIGGGERAGSGQSAARLLAPFELAFLAGASLRPRFRRPFS